MKKLFPQTVCAGLVFLLVLPLFAGDWREVEPGQSVALPGDLHFKKGYRVQWWYLTGHLFDQAGREFGYEMTFFAAGVQQRTYRSEFGVDFIYLSHLAVSDIAGNRYHHYSNGDSGAFGFAGADSRRLHVWVDRSSLKGSAAKMHLTGRAGEIALDLSLVPKKPVVLHGDRGYSRKSEESPLIASRHFSFTDLETTGSLKLGQDSFEVSGKSWFDREISSRGLAENEAGWDWFAIQLDDHREIMLYQMRKKDGELDPFSSGTAVYGNGTHRHLEKKDFTVKIMSRYTSRHTKARYPSKWEVIIPSEDLRLLVTPLIEDQEFTAAGAIRKTYWEGACKVEGSVPGRAYVEMTGY